MISVLLFHFFRMKQDHILQVVNGNACQPVEDQRDFYPAEYDSSFWHLYKNFGISDIAILRFRLRNNPKSHSPQISNFLVFQDIAYKIMVLRKRRQVIVTAAMNAYQRYLMRIYFLQLFTMLNRDQPVFSTMNYISMAINMF